MRKNLHSRLMLLLAAVLMGVGSAWADTSTLTFTAACNGSGTANDGVAWTVTSDGKESTFDNNKGIHYGTGSAAVQYIQLSTSGISGTITKIVVNASTASGVTATVGVTVGGNAFGGDPKSLTTTADEYTFEGSASGEIVVTVTKPLSAAKAIYVKSVAVTYAGGLTESDLALNKSALSFDLYNNKEAQTISYTTSGTGEVTVSESEYVQAVVNANAKTITITPLKKTDEMQTITVSQATDGTYAGGTATFTVTIDDSTPASEIKDETIDFSKQGYENGAPIETVTGKGCTITFDKGTNENNVPKYYTTGTAIRAYGGNIFTVSSTCDKNITGIVITFSSGENANEITADAGTYKDETWTGEAESVTFTISGTTGHRRIASIKVTYADESDTRIATTVTIDATGIINTDVYTSKAAGTLTATVAAGETTLTNPAITWSSSNEDVATVDANGAVTLVAAGTTTITASYAGEEDQYRASSATYELTVTDSTPGETIDFTKQGYSNQQEITTASGQNCTITFNQGTNNSIAPTYYDTGTAIRAYGGNTFTVSSTTKNIIKITITFSSGGGTNEITASEGTYAEGTWTGNARSVTFTIDGTSGHRRIASITVTYADIPQNYRLFTGELVEGDYIIYFYDDQDLSGHVMNNTTVSNSRLQYKYGMEVEPDADKVISTNDATIVWHIAKSGEYWTIYNAEAKAYAASTGKEEEAQMLADGTDDKALWTVSRTGTGTYEFVNKKNAADEVDANLRNNGTDGFACYAPGIGGALSLYKRASVTVTEAGWATYITEENVHFGNDVNAYIVTGNTKTSVTLTKVKDVVKGTPVIVNANAGTYVLENAFEVDEVGDNKLVVYHAETGLNQDYNPFVLAKNASDGSACFKQWIGNNDDLDGRVVLPLELDLTNPNGNPNGVRALSIVFGDTTTGIETVSHATPTMSEGAYTLSGQRVQKPTKGLYIIGGKKVVVK